MTKSRIAASAKLAAQLVAATGMAWEVDESYTNGERVHVPGDGDWRTWTSVMRNGWGEVWLNNHHTDRSQRKRLGMRKGTGWQAKVVPAVVHVYGKVPS